MDKKFVNVYLYLFDSQYVVNKYKKEEDVSFQMRPLCLVIRLGLEPCGSQVLKSISYRTSIF